jgi:hypothetical protein
MDTEEEYSVAKSIVKSQSAEEWNLLRVNPGDCISEDWKQFRNYSVEDLIYEMRVYKQIQIARGEIFLLMADSVNMKNSFDSNC